jgi:hypothetical protein
MISWFQSRPWWLQVGLCILVFAGVFFAWAFIEAFISGMHVSLRHIAPVALLFSLFGAIFGTAATLDSRSKFSDRDRPILRCVLSAIFGGIAVYIVWSLGAPFSPAWIGAGLIVGAILGWYGWAWAKYVVS